MLNRLELTPLLSTSASRVSTPPGVCSGPHVYHCVWAGGFGTATQLPEPFGGVLKMAVLRLNEMLQLNHAVLSETPRRV